MGVRCLEAFQGSELPFSAVDFVVGVDGDGVEGAGSDCCGVDCGFDDHVRRFDGVEINDVDRIRWLVMFGENRTRWLDDFGDESLELLV